MREKYISLENKVRLEEAQRIRDMRDLIASTKAAISLLMGVDPASALKTKQRTAEFLKSSGRNESIRQAMEVDEYCAFLGDRLKRGSLESELAFQTRRLDILSRIIKSDLTEGNQAIVVVDILMGVKKLDVSNMTIVKASVD